MHRALSLLLLLAVLLSACQVSTPAPTTAAPSPSAPVNAAPAASSTPVQAASPTSPPTPPPPGPPLAPLALDLNRPLSANIRLSAWQPQPYAGPSYSLPLDPESLANSGVLEGLTGPQRAFLLENGVLVVHSREAQFSDIRVQVGREDGQPYFLTTDAAYHALHLLFDDLLKSLEKTSFHPRLERLTRAALDQVLLYLEQVQGTPLEADARLAAAYLAVAARLLDPQSPLPPGLSGPVEAQVAQIASAQGRAASVLLPDFEDDYVAYAPVGHYAGDPELEAYYRVLTWYGRVHFKLQDPSRPAFQPTRAPLLITLALRQTPVEGDSKSAGELWIDLHRELSFLIGPTDDAGPLEYAVLMDQVYGENVSLLHLADEARWAEFLSRAAELPAPQINSTFLASAAALESGHGWRFLGQRFTLDGLIFQKLVFDNIQPRGTARRLIPSGLDVMAALGSPAALQALESLGETNYPNYTEELGKLQQAVRSQPEAQWLARFYDGWLFSFLPVLAPKNEAYPPFMRGSVWAFKDLNTALGSWAELKHDTALYTKMPETMGGGGPPSSGPAPAYVEPNPAAFYRLAYLAQTLAEAYQYEDLGTLWAASGEPTAFQYVQGMQKLGEKLLAFGDMAARQLAGVPLTEDDYAQIHDCLGLTECMALVSPGQVPESELPPVPVAAAVHGAEERVLQAAVGLVDRIYVIVPLEGQLQAAQGGVFSYYELQQPRSQHLTDQAWRELLASSSSPALPDWAGSLVLPGGQPVRLTAFRIGDVYLINDAGDRLNLRASPTRSSPVVAQFFTGEYIEILEGPVSADGYTWWKIRPAGQADEAELSRKTGWAVEHQEWYDRAYGQ